MRNQPQGTRTCDPTSPEGSPSTTDAQAPVAFSVAGLAVAKCALRSVELLRARHVHLDSSHVGARIHFGDGTSARIFRETRVDVPTGSLESPCTLAVTFRLRGIHGQWHSLFEHESLLNTPLFVGFPGFVSKLWLAHDQTDAYRGLYEWGSASLATSYARSLWRVLALFSERDSIHYHVQDGHRQDDVFTSNPRTVASIDAMEWWRPINATIAE